MDTYKNYEKHKELLAKFNSALYGAFTKLCDFRREISKSKLNQDEKYFWNALCNDIDKFHFLLWEDISNFLKSCNGVILRQHFKRYRDRKKNSNAKF